MDGVTSCNLVRFRQDFCEKIGQAELFGKARDLGLLRPGCISMNGSKISAALMASFADPHQFRACRVDSADHEIGEIETTK